MDIFNEFDNIVKENCRNLILSSNKYDFKYESEKEKYFKLKEFFGKGYIYDENIENDPSNVRFGTIMFIQ